MAELDFERKHAEDLQRLRGFRLLDDDFMSKVFEDKACSQFLLQIILEKKDLIVQKVHAQHDIKNLQGRSIRLDIIAIDGNGRVYNIEIQRSDKGASIKRTRYNSSLLDANVTEPGDDYENLAETYVIFITENDVLKAGLPIYHIDRIIKETGVMFEDEAHIIYVNSRKQNDTELGKLMHDLHCKKADEMHSPILAKRVYELKETQKGVELMCHEMEKIYSEGMESGEKRGIEIGELKAKKETILSLAEMGIPVNKIAKAVNLSEKDVKKWIDENLCAMK